MELSDWNQFEGQMLEGRYHLNRMLGAGGQGGVFQADEVIADRLIRQTAIKLIETDPQRYEEQVRELIAATNLDHSCLLRCYMPGQCEWKGKTFLYLVTQLAEYSLKDQMQKGALTTQEVWEVTDQVSAALLYLHEQTPPLVHRDIKPANIMRVSHSWKVSDFGLLSVSQGEARQAGPIAGTAAYSPPESYEGTVLPGWDIWSFGVLLVEAIAGKLPYAARTPQEMRIAVASQEPSFLDSLPIPFQAIARGCLAKSPSARWTARQVREALSEGAPIAAMESVSLLPKELLDRLSNASNNQPETGELIVSPTAKGCLRTLAEAVQQARPGALIRVLPGIYTEAIVLNRAVRILGDGPRDQIVIEAVDSPCFMVRTDRARLCGLTLNNRVGERGQRYAAVDIEQGHLQMEDCRIDHASLVCLTAHGDGANATLQRCSLHGGRTGGIHIFQGAQGTFENCEICDCGGPALLITSGANPTFKNCSIHQNRAAGVVVREGGLGMLESCDLVANAGDNVSVTLGGDPILQNCRIADGRQAGIHIRQKGKGRFENCDIEGNTLSNVLIAQEADATLQHCRIYHGHSNGVWISENGVGTIADCDIFANAFAGVKISEGGQPAIQRTTIRAGKRTGVAVHARGMGTLTDCDIQGNTLAGITVDAGGKLMLRRCLIRDGKDVGGFFAGSATLEECGIYGNAKAGLEIVQEGYVVVRRSEIHHGFYPGILVREGGQGTAEDCDIHANAMSGAAAGEGSQLVLRRCRVRGGKQVGILFWERAGGLLDDCDVYGNALGGVQIQQHSDPVLRDCRISENGNYGVCVTEHGGGSVLRCVFRNNRAGNFHIMPGCSVQSLENKL